MLLQCFRSEVQSSKLLEHDECIIFISNKVSTFLCRVQKTFRVFVRLEPIEDGSTTILDCLDRLIFFNFDRLRKKSSFRFWGQNFGLALRNFVFRCLTASNNYLALFFSCEKLTLFFLLEQ